MGVLVGGFIILVNARTLLNTWIDQTAMYPFIYAGIAVIWIGAIAYIAMKIRTTKATEVLS